VNLTLTRNEFRPDGVFSTLTDESGVKIASTLEHAYDDISPGEWLPKIPDGTYTCVRGQHRLARMQTSFETFEVTNVPGHTNILFHIGNFDNDSEGCILLGENVANTKPQMITNSKSTFVKFMELQDGVSSFTLTVV
jgi:hypothetical protein